MKLTITFNLYVLVLQGPVLSIFIKMLFNYILFFHTTSFSNVIVRLYQILTSLQGKGCKDDPLHLPLQKYIFTPVPTYHQNIWDFYPGLRLGFVVLKSGTPTLNLGYSRRLNLKPGMQSGTPTLNLGNSRGHQP